MTKFVILCNNGVFVGTNDKNVFTREELDVEFGIWNNGTEMLTEDDEVVTVDDLIELGNCGERVDIYNENMVEMGDDFVSVSIVELTL